MHPVNAASAPTGVFAGVGVEDFTNFQLLSAALLVLTSFAFAFPAAVSWHTKQLWHAWMFGTMILISVTYSYCSTEFPKHGLGLTAGCDPETTTLLLRVSNAGLYLCFLQMALLLLCPMDPKRQQEGVLARLGSADSAGKTATPASLVEGAAALISKGEASQQASSVPDTAASSSEGGATTSSAPPPRLPLQHLSENVPADVMFCSRVIPVAAFALLNYIHAGSKWEDAHWQSVFLSSTLLGFCCTSFWLQHERRSLAPTVLLRLQYWRRLGHSCCVPSMLSITLLAMANSAESKLLHSLWQVAVAWFAVGVLRNISSDGSAASTPAAQSPPSAPVSVPPTTASAAAALVPAAASPCDDTTLLDASQASNPNVAHMLVAAVAAVVFPALVADVTVDWKQWCAAAPGAGWSGAYWETLSSEAQHQLVESCSPEGYFVATAAIPAFIAMAGVFWLIDSTATWDKSLALLTAAGSSIEPSQKALGKRLGCWIGYLGVAFGILATLVMRGSPLCDLVNTCSSFTSLFLLMIAMALTVLSSDPAAKGFNTRSVLTKFVCLPVMGFLLLLVLVHAYVQSESVMLHRTYAATGYLALMLLAIWPLTWSSELKHTWQGKSRETFEWTDTEMRCMLESY